MIKYSNFYKTTANYFLQHCVRLEKWFYNKQKENVMLNNINFKPGKLEIIT